MIMMMMMMMMMSHSEKWKERLCCYEIDSSKVLVERTQFLNGDIERSD
jgi:hypothetical protein